MHFITTNANIKCMYRQITYCMVSLQASQLKEMIDLYLQESDKVKWYPTLKIFWIKTMYTNIVISYDHVLQGNKYAMAVKDYITRESTLLSFRRNEIIKLLDPEMALEEGEQKFLNLKAISLLWKIPVNLGWNLLWLSFDIVRLAIWIIEWNAGILSCWVCATSCPTWSWEVRGDEGPVNRTHHSEDDQTSEQGNVCIQSIQY